jgi:hypothetical protein
MPMRIHTSKEPHMPCELDHIVIGAATLEQGTRLIREKLGVEIPPGGKHRLMGTHNHVMRLGASAFLEVNAIDPNAPPPSRARWFDLDDPAMRARLAESPRVIAWVVRVTDVAATAARAVYPIGAVIPVTRDALSWRLTVPVDGRVPGKGVLPHAIQWDDGMRPWERMADRGCTLASLTLVHPEPAVIEAGLRSVGAGGLGDVHVKQGAAPGLALSIRAPSGALVTL